MSLHARCDQCGATADAFRYESAPQDWLAIEQGAEDPLHLCSWSCLATFATQQAIDAEVGS